MKRGARTRIKAFTLVEVALAASVMVMVIASSIIVLQYGMRAIDTARYTTLAGQILQSQMEKLRLLNWTQLTYPGTARGVGGSPAGTGGPINFSTFAPDVTSVSTAQINRFTANGEAGRFLQSITDAPAPYADQMKIITLTATWIGSDGQSHSRSYTTRYVKYGISDFFYTSH
jgi:type II secretory pathway pseudopilin PulG